MHRHPDMTPPDIQDEGGSILTILRLLGAFLVVGFLLVVSLIVSRSRDPMSHAAWSIITLTVITVALAIFLAWALRRRLPEYASATIWKLTGAAFVLVVLLSLLFCQVESGPAAGTGGAWVRFFSVMAWTLAILFVGVLISWPISAILRRRPTPSPDTPSDEDGYSAASPDPYHDRLRHRSHRRT